MDDQRYMQRCLQLARKALGQTSPNPLVGCVVVDDDGNIIAEGFHSRAGQPHAEIEALQQVGEAARGKTLYVNLEPCCHFGRTPPCSQRVIASGVKRVVCGMTDPNPKVSGGGLSGIADAGIEITCGVLEDECRYLNRAFIKWINTGRPWVALKMACTLDGRIADRNGHSKWITGEKSRQFVHNLRNEYDAVLIGGATAIADDPELTVRGIEGGRDPFRAVIDSRLALPPTARLANNPDGKTLVFAGDSAIAARGDQYADKSVRLIAAHLAASASPECLAEGSAPLPAASSAGAQLNLGWILDFLGEDNMLSVLCEGGGRLAAALLDEELVDEIYWFIAPKLLGDATAIPVLASTYARPLREAVQLRKTSTVQLGDDVLFHGLLTTP